MMNRIMNEPLITAAAMAVAITLGFAPALAADTSLRKDVAAAAEAVSQASYASPEEAARALYEAVKGHNVKSIYAVLGPGSEQLIYTGDEVADQQMQERFVAAYDHSLKVERDGDTTATLLLGENESPFPFPLVKGAQGWQFDAAAGAEEIINRRIGENELFAIKVCLAYGDAQNEYAEADRDGDGLIEYAQKFRSSEGKHDGLYWPTGENEQLSPLGPLFARAQAEGYTAKDTGPVPYHGYYYRILTGQGGSAAGGAYDYIVNGNMIGGYAIVAYPAVWGSSGVMTFIANHNGVVYQKNLGPDTTEIALKITRFDPDESWQKAE